MSERLLRVLVLLQVLATTAKMGVLLLIMLISANLNSTYEWCCSYLSFFTMSPPNPRVARRRPGKAGEVVVLLNPTRFCVCTGRRGEGRRMGEREGSRTLFSPLQRRSGGWAGASMRGDRDRSSLKAVDAAGAIGGAGGWLAQVGTILVRLCRWNARMVAVSCSTVIWNITSRRLH